MNQTVVGLGEILWDIFPNGKQLGGAPVNFIYFVQNLLGIKSTIVSSVGDDPLGGEILSHLEALSLSTDYITIDKEHPTGKVIIEIDDNHNHLFKIEENVAWDFIHDCQSLKSLAKKTSLVCFGSLAQRSLISRNTIRSFLKNLSENALAVYDINLRQSFYSKEIIEKSLVSSNILKVNDDELPVLANMFKLNGKENYLLKQIAQIFNLKIIVYTKGGCGSIIYSTEEDNFYNHGGFKIDVADSVGAGDSFTASVVVGLLNGYDYNYINESANRVAAYVCSQHGATPNLTDELISLFDD